MSCCRHTRASWIVALLLIWGCGSNEKSGTPKDENSGGAAGSSEPTDTGGRAAAGQTGGSSPGSGGGSSGHSSSSGGNPSQGGSSQAGGGAAGSGISSGGSGLGGAANGGADTGGAENAGTPNGGYGPGGADTGGSESAGAPSGGSSAGGTENGGSENGGTANGGTENAGAPNGGGNSGGAGSIRKFVGNITTRGQVRTDFSDYWDQITPENEGKWGSVEQSRGVWNWTSLDAIYEYAQIHGIIFKEHTFIWGSAQPGWMTGSDMDQEARTWMSNFCERYPDTKLIDVVNEPPPHTTPPFKEALGGDGTSGYDWIVNSFKWAREYCPGAILILNDYNIIEYEGDNAHIIDIVNRVKEAGGPIDAIGCQAHYTYEQPTATVQGFIDNILTQTGLPIYITEFDINLGDDDEQASAMRSYFTMFWNNQDIKGITLWGYVVGATWMDNTGLITSDGQMRPAMTWLMDYLGR